MRYGVITQFVGEGGTLRVTVLGGLTHSVEVHAWIPNWYSVPGAASDGMATLMPVVLATQPAPSHRGAEGVCEGHFTTEVEEKPGNDEVTTRCTPEFSSDAAPPLQSRVTVVPGTTPKEESSNSGFPKVASRALIELSEAALAASVGEKSTGAIVVRATKPTKKGIAFALRLTHTPAVTRAQEDRLAYWAGGPGRTNCSAANLTTHRGGVTLPKIQTARGGLHMLARRQLPPEFEQWNLKWGAPYGRPSDSDGCA